MDKFEKTTLDMIHTVAKKEFLIKGFKSASLRNIEKTQVLQQGLFTVTTKVKRNFLIRW